MSTIPDTLGIFALPHTVLFPQALLPLHIFEPRYRALLADAVDGSGRFVVALSRPGGDGIHRTACVGRILERETLEDGGSDVILRGEAPVRIEDVVAEEPYRSARVRVLTGHGSFEDAPGAEERCAELHRLLEEACPGCLTALRDGWPGEFDAGGGAELLHTVAMYLPVDMETKLRWLACKGSLERWHCMRETLEAMGAARRHQQIVMRRYEDLLPDEPGRN